MFDIWNTSALLCCNKLISFGTNTFFVSKWIETLLTLIHTLYCCGRLPYQRLILSHVTGTFTQRNRVSLISYNENKYADTLYRFVELWHFYSDARKLWTANRSNFIPNKLINQNHAIGDVFTSFGFVCEVLSFKIQNITYTNTQSCVYTDCLV